MKLVPNKKVMIAMSDPELTRIRRKKLRDLKKRLAPREEDTSSQDTDAILNDVFKGRAWEVFNTANLQFPGVMGDVKNALVKLVLHGGLKEITGEQLYQFLRRLGLRVKLNTRISFTEDGKLKSLAEKLKDDMGKAS